MIYAFNVFINFFKDGMSFSPGLISNLLFTSIASKGRFVSSIFFISDVFFNEIPPLKMNGFCDG